MTDWRPDEIAYAGPEHLDPDGVGGYDAKAGFDPEPEVALLTELGLGPDTTLVDLGCGTGVFAEAAARTGARIIAVDVSPTMVRSARARLDAAGDETTGDKRVRVVEAGLLTYRHGGEPVDIVYSRNVLHQLPDLWKATALDRMRGLLRPGGLLRLHDLVFDVEPAELDTTVEAWMAGAAEDPALGYTAEDFATHLRTEYSTYTWLLEPMLERAGFEVVERSVRRSVYASYTCRVAGP